jgi:DNA-binding NarL/FixJ family response regulator
MKRRRQPRITPLQIAHVKMFSVCGWRQKDIATEVGLCKSTVGEIQRGLGLWRYEKQPLPSDMQKEILTLYRSGLAIAAVARELAIAPHRVRFFLRAAGVKIRVPQRNQFNRDKLHEIRQARLEFFRVTAGKFGVSQKWLKNFYRGKI